MTPAEPPLSMNRHKSCDSTSHTKKDAFMSSQRQTSFDTVVAPSRITRRMVPSSSSADVPGARTEA